MTPLARHIIKDSLQPKGKRRYSGKGPENLGLLDKHLHFFECSEVVNDAATLGQDLAVRQPRGAERLAFLPARRTWIEAIRGTWQNAYLLEQINDTSATLRYIYLDANGSLHYSPNLLNLPLFGGPDVPNNYGEYEITTTLKRPDDTEIFFELAWTTYALLAIINTPRIFSREEHAPHRGLLRKLTPRVSGLRGWTEIKLGVQPPKTYANDPDEPTLTGKRAKHFVRSHLRIKLGKLELVSPHWRGDPALGIVRSRYVVEGDRLNV